jgi:hypothetical protein
MEMQDGRCHMNPSPMQDECSWQDDGVDSLADSAQLEMYTVPLRAKHAVRKPLAQQGGYETQQQRYEAQQQGYETQQQGVPEHHPAMQEPLVSTGLTVKVNKGEVLAGQSPAAAADGSIKAFFEVCGLNLLLLGHRHTIVCGMKVLHVEHVHP